MDNSIIVIDTIPKAIIYGVQFADRFGINPGFTKHLDTNEQYYQAQIFFQLLQYGTNKVLYEFRTVSNYRHEGSPEDNLFLDKAHAFTLSAIAGFNGHLNKHASPFILTRNYTPIPPIEQNKEAIRKGFVIYQFDHLSGAN